MALALLLGACGRDVSKVVPTSGWAPDKPRSTIVIPTLPWAPDKPRSAILIPSLPAKQGTNEPIDD